MNGPVYDASPGTMALAPRPSPVVAAPEILRWTHLRSHAATNGGAFGRALLLSVVEARPCVLIMFLLRFCAGAAMAPEALQPQDLPRLSAAAFSWSCAVGFVYLYNGAADLDGDRVSGKGRPIARGDLDRRTAITVAVGAGVGSEVLALLLGAEFAWLTAALLLLGYAYSCPRIALKRHCAGAALVAAAGGVLTFTAGSVAIHSGPPSPPLMVLLVAMSGWMGLVGSVAKDFSDVRGDRCAGRRTLVLLVGRRSAGMVVAATAASVAVSFVVAAMCWAPGLLLPALTLLVGAVAVSVTALGGSARWRPRASYRAYMVTQYLTVMTAIGTVVA